MFATPLTSEAEARAHLARLAARGWFFHPDDDIDDTAAAELGCDAPTAALLRARMAEVWRYVRDPSAVLLDMARAAEADAPGWFTSALARPSFYIVEAGEHGIFSLRHATSGRYLTDADSVSAAVAACYATGEEGPSFAVLADALAWASTPDGTPREEWAED